MMKMENFNVLVLFSMVCFTLVLHSVDLIFESELYQKL